VPADNFAAQSHHTGPRGIRVAAFNWRAQFVRTNDHRRCCRLAPRSPTPEGLHGYRRRPRLTTDTVLSTADRRPERVSTETKASFKTTELIFYILAVAGVLIASKTISANDPNGGDFFRADRAWLYITLLTIGYMISRGLAKSGSREPYDR